MSHADFPAMNLTASLFCVHFLVSKGEGSKSNIPLQFKEGILIKELPIAGQRSEGENALRLINQ